MSKLIRMSLVAGLLGVCLGISSARTPEYDKAEALYKQTYYDQSIRILNNVSNKDGDSWELLGKNWFMLGDFKKAGDAFEKALAINPDSSSYIHWMGRVYGRRAESGNPFTAPGNATKARKYFERAVELDPRNGEALNDLFEYYLEAPGMLGGGLDKAATLVDRIGKLDRAEMHYAQARLAEKRRQFREVEQQLRTAAELAPTQVGRLIDLARFLSKQGRVQESDAAFQRARRVEPNSPKLMFHEAAAYIETNRNLDKARTLLQAYLKAPLTADDPPRDEARKLLKQARPNGD